MWAGQFRERYHRRLAVEPRYVWTLKFDPSQPRDERGRWTVAEKIAEFKAKYPVVAFNYPRSSHTEMGSIESHTKDVGREWEKQLSSKELAGISERFGSDVQKLMASTIPLHDIGKAQALESGVGREKQHEYTIPIMQEVLRKEGFNEKDIALATELTNHDLIGPLFRGYEGFSAKEADVVAKLQEKVKKVGMNVPDFVTLQLAFYQADASAYPYITQYMDREPSGKWTFKGRKQIAAIEALIRKREYVREPAGSPKGGEFAKTTEGGGGFDPKNKDTWYRNGGSWNTSVDGEDPYGWRQDLTNYVPPTRTHKMIRGANAGIWGGSHHGSQVITGDSAQQMGIEGYEDLGASKEAKAVATRMLTAIAEDKEGSEEPLYHSFENTRGTVFKPGDTMRLPLTATSGRPESYGKRLERESQDGAPTFFAFPKGTPMSGYSTVTERSLEDIGQPTVEAQYKEQGYVWDEAIVAGKFRVTKVETKYMGSQHSRHGIASTEAIPQLYGQVVHLEPLEVFDPVKKQWVPRG